MASFSNHRINVQVGSMATKLKQVYFSYKQNKTKKSLTLLILLIQFEPHGFPEVCQTFCGLLFCVCAECFG